MLLSAAAKSIIRRSDWAKFAHPRFGTAVNALRGPTIHYYDKINTVHKSHHVSPATKVTVEQKRTNEWEDDYDITATAAREKKRRTDQAALKLKEKGLPKTVGFVEELSTDLLHMVDSLERFYDGQPFRVVYLTAEERKSLQAEQTCTAKARAIQNLRNRGAAWVVVSGFSPMMADDKRIINLEM